MNINKDKLMTLFFLLKLNLMEAKIVLMDKLWYYGFPLLSMIVFCVQPWKGLTMIVIWLLAETVVNTIKDYKDK